MNMKLMAAVFNDIAQTLHFIHSKGFLHNDLKTNNLLLERTTPQVTFFSFQKMLELAVSGQSFFPKFSDLVSKATSSVASQRISANVTSLLLLEKMNKFKTCRGILLLSHPNNISEEEFVRLYDCNIVQKIQISAINRTMFSI